MTSEAFKEIYRGYLIDYNIEYVDTKPEGKEVLIFKDDKEVHACGGVEAAYEWIDKEKKRLFLEAKGG